ncbi:MAG: hypothetical protein WA728_17260, partial [Xanthobacteraceae bacterium]
TKSGALQTNSIERSFSEVDVAKFEQLIKDYRRALLRVVRASRGDPQKQEASARKLIWSSRSAHTCAALRATVRKNRYASPEQIRGMATAGKRWQPITEPVTAWWRPKSGGGYRLVTEDGIVRTAQRLVLRDMLTVMNIDSEFDYSRRGKGEKALITRVCDLMDSEFDWWAMLDIKNYFASLKPGHFGWLPLTRQEITNIVFTPKCAEVVVVILPKQMEHPVGVGWLLKAEHGAVELGGDLDVVHDDVDVGDGLNISSRGKVGHCSSPQEIFAWIEVERRRRKKSGPRFRFHDLPARDGGDKADIGWTS